MPMTPTRAQEELKYKTEDDLRTLKRAEEIKSDKQRFNRATKLAAEQMKIIQKFAKS
tara:strand:+ start:5231 stop:5401 length:171 start_codon:yes stop_codon:yes gene_type:complete